MRNEKRKWDEKLITMTTNFHLNLRLKRTTNVYLKSKNNLHLKPKMTTNFCLNLRLKMTTNVHLKSKNKLHLKPQGRHQDFNLTEAKIQNFNEL